jgi:hypothetical protein
VIRYSNSVPVDVLYTCDGTKASIITNITAALHNAGWSSLGSGQYQSAVTPAGLKIRVDVIDPGSASVHLRLRSPSFTNLGTSNGAVILPVTGRNFRILANQYQLFHFLSGAGITTDGCDVAFGVPWTPPYITNMHDNSTFTLDPWMGWLACNGVNETPGGFNSSTLFCFHGSFPRMHNSGGGMWIWDNVSYYDSGGGDLTYLVGQTASNVTMGDVTSAVWVDGSVSVYEPYIAWPSGHSTSGNWSPPVRKGQLWDCLVYGLQFSSEAILSFDDRRWRGITQRNNVGGGAQLPHTLMHLTN